MLLLGVLFALITSILAIEQNWRNTNALRTIDLTKSYVKESLAIIIENISEKPQSRYLLPQELNTTYSFMEVREKGAKSTTPTGLDVVLRDSLYEVQLPQPVLPGEKLTLSVASAKLHELRPLPVRIEQNGKQYLICHSSKTIPSFYQTLKEKTKFKLPNADIPEITDGGERQGNVVSFGPFEGTIYEPTSRVSVRYESTTPLSTVSYFERDIEISHWGGNIAFEDRYALTNSGAHLKGQFDRIAFAQSGFYNPQSAAIKNMVLPLPVGSRDAYFTDEIGNVSTSKFRSSFREANLELKPRYPIFGGWNYTFTVGWNNDLANFMTRSGTKHYLRVPFLEGPENIYYEDVLVRIILPEGASNLKLSSPVTANREMHGIHKTFMDTTGRSVIILTAQNLVDEKAKQEMYIEYDYSTTAIYRKPGVLMSIFGLMFGSSIFLNRIM